MDSLLRLSAAMDPLLPPEVRDSVPCCAPAPLPAAPQHAPPPAAALDLDLALVGSRSSLLSDVSAPPPPPQQQPRPPQRAPRPGTTVVRAGAGFLRSVTFHDRSCLAPPPLVYPHSPVTPPPARPPPAAVSALPLLSSAAAPGAAAVAAAAPAAAAVAASPTSPGPAVRGRVIRKPKTYAKPVASRFCHICSRMPRRGQGSVTCCNMSQGLCRKIVCQRCVVEQGWDFAAISAAKDSWLCPHCAGVCPPRSQCHIYNRINARRKRIGEEDAAEERQSTARARGSSSAASASPAAKEAEPAKTSKPEDKELHLPVWDAASSPVSVSVSSLVEFGGAAECVSPVGSAVRDDKAVMADLASPFAFLFDPNDAEYYLDQ